MSNLDLNGLFEQKPKPPKSRLIRECDNTPIDERYLKELKPKSNTLNWFIAFLIGAVIAFFLTLTVVH